MRSARGDLTRPPRPEPPAGVLARQGPSPGFPRPQHPPGLAPWDSEMDVWPPAPVHPQGLTHSGLALPHLSLGPLPTLSGLGPGPTSPAIYTHTHTPALPPPLPWLPAPLGEVPRPPARCPRPCVLCSAASDLTAPPNRVPPQGWRSPSVRPLGLGGACSASTAPSWQPGMFPLTVYDFKHFFIISLPHPRDPTPPTHAHPWPQLRPHRPPGPPLGLQSPHSTGAPYDPWLEATLVVVHSPPGHPAPSG